MSLMEDLVACKNAVMVIKVMLIVVSLVVVVVAVLIATAEVASFLKKSFDLNLMLKMD